jgi:serine/threonine-protein phosphatase 6 regulatory ankyrin repeat subunit A/serine/threonine-protein phosphatase 6 regulatory ankyrin repeat subunit B
VHAVKSGDVREVKRCIVSGADVNGKHEENKTALHYASERGGSLEIVNLFFPEIAKPTLEIVKCLVEHGADINEKDEKNKTALHYAAERGSLENVKYLVEHGADINAKDEKNKTALHYATESRDSEMVSDSIYFLPVTKQLPSLELVKYLVEHGADVNAKDEKNKTALHYATERGSLEFVKCLVEHGADVNAKDEKNKTALHYATERRDSEMVRYSIYFPPVTKQLPSLELVKYLVEHGADVNAKDEKNKTALHYATERRDSVYFSPVTKQLPSLELVKYLVEHGADVNAKDEKNKTALHYAAERGSLENVKYLVEHGADINAKDEKNKTALHYATESRDSEMVSDSIYFLSVTKQLPSLELVKYLVEHGADVNAKDEKNMTALHYAAILYLSEIFMYLVEHGADINEKDENNRTALHYAAERGLLEIVKYLVKHGADINAKDEKNKTALHYAAKRGLSKIVRYLVQHGANEWNSALTRACYRGKTAAVRALMNAKVDIQNVEDLIRRSGEVINTIELDLKKSIKPGQKIRILKAMDNEKLTKVIYFYCDIP